MGISTLHRHRHRIKDNSMREYGCEICHKHIIKEAHGADMTAKNPRASAGDHDSAEHVLFTYNREEYEHRSE